MTVAVGFMCVDGVVLAADREVSTPTVKFDGPKVWSYAYPRGSSNPTVKVGVAGAGDYGFIRYASERIDATIDQWMQRRASATMDEVNSLIQGVINDVHHNHLYPVGQPHERPAIELLLGIWLKGGRYRLARTSLTAISKVWDYEAIGIGSDLATFLVKRAYFERIPISSAVFWATEVLMHAKHYVPGCGSSSDVLVMFKNGTVGTIKPDTIKQHEQFAIEFEAVIQTVFLGGRNPAVSDAAFVQQVDELAVKLKSLRTPTVMEKQVAQAEDVTAMPTPPSESQEGSPVQQLPKRGRKRRPPSQG